MAVNFVGGGLLASGTSPIQVNYVSTAGNFLVAFCYTFTTTAVFTVTDSIGGTWTAGPAVTSTNARTQLFYKENSAAVAWVRVTISATGGTSRLVVGEFSGVKTSGALENTKTNFGNGSNNASGAFTVTSGDLIVGCLANGAGTSPTAGAGFTAPAATRDAVVCLEYQTAASTSANAVFVSGFGEFSLTAMGFFPVPGTPAVATPTVDNAAGTYADSVTVTVSCTEPGAAMCYRLDGVDPVSTTPGTCDGGSTTYTGPITISSTTTLKVIASKAAFSSSSVLTQTYTVRPAATYYVSTSGSDAAAGTEVAPWAHAPGMTGVTGVAAAAVLVGGDTVKLKCGDTWSATTMTCGAGGISGKQITLTSYSTGAKPIISATANSPAITLTVANRGYWTIDGLDLRASGLVSGINLPASIYHNYWGADMLAVPGWIIQNCVSNASFYLSGPNTTVRLNTLDGTANSNPPFGGIILRSDVNTGGIVEYNDVSHFADRGIWINRAANNAHVRYNHVHDITGGADNTGMGINFDGFEVAVTGGHSYGNWIHSCAGMGITHENGTGSRCYYNLIHDCVQAGADVINYSAFQTLPSDIEFSYNVIYNVNIGIVMIDAQGVKVIGNTFVNGTGANSYAFGISSLDTNVQDLTFTNNIVGGVWTHPIHVRTTKSIWTQFDYNDIVPTGTEVLFQVGGSVSQTLAQLQALGLMTHGTTANPQFVAGSGSAYAIAAGSPANGSGTNLGSAYQTALKPTATWPANIVTGSQASAWDMGAYLQSPTGTGGGDAGGGHGPSAYRIRKRRRENLERQMR